jgi:hypothetical protein
MSNRNKTKKPPPYFYDGPPQSQQEKETETEDVYDTAERETMLDNDDITAAEEGFMRDTSRNRQAKKKHAKTP